MNTTTRTARQRQTRTFKVVLTYLASEGVVGKYRARVGAIGVVAAAELAASWLIHEKPGVEIIQRTAKLVQRTSVLRRQAQPDGLGRALPCC